MIDQNASAGTEADSAAELDRLQSRFTALEAEVERERSQATDYMKRWQYAQADLANMRRRTQQERDDLVKFGIAPLAGALLEVLDNFERAEQTLPSALRSYTWISGVFLIHHQIQYLLQQHGLEPIAAAGERYDPAVHEAVSEEAHDTVEDGLVIADVQRGYRLHGRMLRPALVRVSKGPAAAAQTGGGEADAATAPPAVDGADATPPQDA